MLEINTIYYLAVSNQVAGSEIGGAHREAPVCAGAPPINFRDQNTDGFEVGQIVNTNDACLSLTPWLAAIE